jgi:hypothetical protein
MATNATICLSTLSHEPDRLCYHESSFLSSLVTRLHAGRMQIHVCGMQLLGILFLVRSI